MNAIAGLNKENLNTQGEIFKSLKSFEIIVSELDSHEFCPERKFITLRIWALIIRRKMTWMKWVKRGCQKQYWKDKVSEGKEHTLLPIQSATRFGYALGKKAPGKDITRGLPSNQFLSHTQPPRARNTTIMLFQVTNPWLCSI